MMHLIGRTASKDRVLRVVQSGFQLMQLLSLGDSQDLVVKRLLYIGYWGLTFVVVGIRCLVSLKLAFISFF